MKKTTALVGVLLITLLVGARLVGTLLIAASLLIRLALLIRTRLTLLGVPLGIALGVPLLSIILLAVSGLDVALLPVIQLASALLVIARLIGSLAHALVVVALFVAG